MSFKNLDGAKLDALVKQIGVVAVGPGLSTEGDAPAFARQVVEKTTVPVVIDADALNAFAGKAHLLNGERQGVGVDSASGRDGAARRFDGEGGRGGPGWAGAAVCYRSIT